MREYIPYRQKPEAKDKERLKWKEKEEQEETEVWGKRWKISAADSH